ncbi:MAG TPA: DHA2 family efflux MFS transporter permease subunit, partial [Thermomicrobiales bacterium]|nr:DHA2 family efflux MFS transporter permease subunit [Thermomicrobiales bacterium]
MTSPASRDTGQTESANPWAVLAVLCTSIFMLLLDTTIVNNAQRKIQLGLEADLSQIQWILDSYILVYAVLLLTFGRMGDIFGRKRFFLVGVAVFTIASGLCGVAGEVGDVFGVSGANALIAARALQGFGGAMMMPQSLSIITQVFPPETRGSALGIWGGVVALGAISGPLIGGFIATNYPWEWVFLINLPIGAVGLVASQRILPETFDPNASRSLDWGGVVLSGMSIFMLVFALIEGNLAGWTSPQIVGLLLGAAILFPIFLWWERRQAEPMVRLELFAIRNFAVANAMLVMISFGVFGIFFPLTLFLQAGIGYTPLEAGLVTAPMAVMQLIVAPLSGRFSDRYGSRVFLVTGMGLAALGIAMIAWQTSPDTTWRELLLPTIVTGIGMGMLMSPLTAAAMRQVPRGIAGSASGIINTTRSIGQLMGIAVLGTVLQSRMAQETDPRLDRLALDAGMQGRLVRMAEAAQFEQITEELASMPDLLSPVMTAVHQAFADAVQFTFFVSAALALLG